jgi:hypothetical protein
MKMGKSEVVVPDDRKGVRYGVGDVGVVPGSGTASARSLSARHCRAQQRPVSAPSLERATQTLRGVTSAWIKDQRVKLADGRVAEYQVNMEVTFVLEG